MRPLRAMFHVMRQGFARFVGVELSGAAFAGLHTWVAAGRVDGKALVVESVQQLADLSRGVTEREVALPGLARWVAKQRHTVVAVRAPFGLPAELVKDKEWVDFARAFSERFPQPEGFLAEFDAQAQGRFLMRTTDRLTGLRSNPHKRRVGFQTWANLRHVTGPLVAEQRAVAAPMQSPSGDLPVLVETHVGAALRVRRIAPPFMGALEVCARSRSAVLDRLAELEALQFDSPAVRTAPVDQPDLNVIGSVVAAVVAGRLAREPGLLSKGLQDPVGVEGHIYV